ncbi:EAL domain-containing protein [Amycolatopsis sp. CA-230715]|uniref:EAL domain-containing protein n=1 Tax=Amycolatopsis sp. CA-230715 TaxID=2745196 RepID=UPI001C03398C|nr:hypothetical protein HUW46_04697 [Amycolatopsis sp. CA-230715]
MEAGGHDATRDRGADAVTDRTVGAEPVATWSADFTTNTVTWTPQIPTVLSLTGTNPTEIRDRLAELVAPLTALSKTARVGDEVELDQAYRSPDGDQRWIRLRAHTVGDETVRGLSGVASDVTEQHTDRQALADLSDRYRLLVELSPDGICVHQNGIVVYANPSAVRMVGAANVEAVLGRALFDFVEPRSLPELKARIASLGAPGARSEPTEMTMRTMKGGTLAMETVSVRTTWQGRPAYQAIMRDITAQKAAAAALRYQAALVTHVSDAIIATDRHGLVTSWNPAAESVYARSAAEAIGKPVREVVGAQLDPGWVVRFGGVIQTAHRRADGVALAIRVSASEMGDGYVLVCADETARRRAEQHFSTVVASLDEGVMVIGPTGVITTANPAAHRILGIVGTAALVGMRTSELALYDEAGRRIPQDGYPTAMARRSGEPQNGRVVRVRGPEGRSVWLSLTARTLNPDDPGPPSVVASFTDITERRAIAERLAHEATHDPLTGLANRTLVLRRLTAALGQSDVTSVLFIDLDKFKVINDSLGHSVGDRVLQAAGERLHQCVSPRDLVGRLGGDEFVVVTSTVTDREEVTQLTERLRAALTRPVAVDGRQLHVDASVGIVLAARGDERTAEDLLRDADVAMYQAKTLGRGRYEFFDVELRERMQRRLRLEQDLRAGVHNGQLWPAYQPVVDIATKRIVAVEALLRWDHPAHGPVSPTEFIPLAEESDLINTIGAHVLTTTVHEVAGWRDRRGVELDLEVNLSVRQLEDPGLVPAVSEVLRMTGLSPESLCLEVTESALMRDPSAASGVLQELRDLGARLAIDDFGTGYSSLAQLRKLPLDTLKIDQTFVAELGTSREAAAIVASIIAMAHAVGLTVIAEGVETSGQLQILAELGCDQAQGYYFGKPGSAAALLRLIGPDQRWAPEPC